MSNEIEVEFRFVGSGEERLTEVIKIRRTKLVRLLLECAKAEERGGDFESAKHYEHLAELARTAKKLVLRTCDVGACVSDVPIAVRDEIIELADVIK